jgi:hypothetical protein
MVIQGKRLRKSHMCAKLRWEMRLKPFRNYFSNTQIKLRTFQHCLKRSGDSFLNFPTKWRPVEHIYHRISRCGCVYMKISREEADSQLVTRRPTLPVGY